MRREKAAMHLYTGLLTIVTVGQAKSFLCILVCLVRPPPHAYNNLLLYTPGTLG